MNIAQTGVILYTREYQKTLDFYQTIFKLKTLYRKPTLTCFNFHGSYLMIEQDEEVNLNQGDPKGRDKFCVRFNVPDVREACKSLEKHKVAFSYYEHDWGTIAQFRDPDGNLVGIRSSKEHEEDLSSNN